MVKRVSSTSRERSSSSGIVSLSEKTRNSLLANRMNAKGETSKEVERKERGDLETDTVCPRQLCLGHLIKALPNNVQKQFRTCKLKNVKTPMENPSCTKAEKETLPDLSQLRITEVALQRTTAYKQSVHGVCVPNISTTPPLEYILRRRLYSKHRKSGSVSESNRRAKDTEDSVKHVLGKNPAGRKFLQVKKFKSARRNSRTKLASAQATRRGNESSAEAKQRSEMLKMRRGTMVTASTPNRKPQHLTFPRIFVS